MSVSASVASERPRGASLPLHGLRFGVAKVADDAVEWVLKRNCSIAPQQLLAAYAALCILSLGIAGFFWTQGATLVMPFAWAEMIAVGAALWVHGRHAGDRERIEFRRGRVTVELTRGARTDRVELGPEWVSVGPRRGSSSLIELSSRGRTVAVGRHLRPELRPLLAKELREVLGECGVFARRETV
jgi:uncharacterized membrane protein